MTDRDTAVLAHHLRRLDTERCAELVADLWAARGFETGRDGEEVVATGRDGGRRIRIRVGRGAGSEDPPDVVVALRGDRDAPDATAGGRLVDAEGLAGMLRYAVDRETAAALCERHLGAPPDELRPPARERLGDRLDALRAATRVDPGDSPVAPAAFLAAALALVLLAAGAVAGVALTGSSGGPSADAGEAVEPLAVPESTPVDGAVVGTRTPTRTEGADAEPVRSAAAVPGLTEDGIADLSALAAAHARTLLGGSYTLWIDTYRPPGGDPDGPRTQFDTDVAVSGERFLIEENAGDDGDRRRLRTLYHDGADWYVANETADGRVYERITLREPTPPPSPNPDNIALGLVADYLSTPETAVEGRVGSDGSGTTRYRLVGRGTPPTMDADEVRNYTFVALVDRDGLVRDLTVTYTRTADGGSYRVRKEWTYGRLGETSVETPAWYVERFAADTESP